jgi:glycosyltransferase involved in cell wall biosynthesis
MRIAWFSPLPPDRSGIAAYSAELITHLAPHIGVVDLYGGPNETATAKSSKSADPNSLKSPLVSVRSPHDFVWRHRRDPYDIVVYQLGNSDAHDFMWAYLFRYPGLLVLHDAQVHQARALWLLRRIEPRLEDYLAELVANHPAVAADLGHLFAAGLGGQLYRLWPLVSLAIRASKLTVVHNAHLARRLAREHPGAVIRHIEMGVADSLGTVPRDAATQGPVPSGEPTHGTVPSVRGRHGVPADACVVGAFGGVTPEKRIPQLLEALAAARFPHLHALLVGPPAAHYDVAEEVQRLGLETRVHLAGYVPDVELPAYLAATDICWCLRWPSNGETSASWLRCLAAGRPTLITALAQLQDVPALPVNADGVAAVSTCVDAVAIAIDPVDERRDIGHAFDLLARDAALRDTLGANARARWARLHTLPQMASAYAHVLDQAARHPAPEPTLPAHLRDEGTGTAQAILTAAGVSELPW